MAYFYPRSPRGERLDVQTTLNRSDLISIHAPREGSDTENHCRYPVQRGISIHAPREGSDALPCRPWCRCPISIHAPREGSDRCPSRRHPRCRHFYPRSPRGERHPICGLRGPVHGDFYPRSPRGERRTGGVDNSQQIKFLSTLPARGATGRRHRDHRRPGNFYPRSPRGERPAARTAFDFKKDFYPRSPRGERQAAHAPSQAWARFLSTLPARGATRELGLDWNADKFLSTLPARGATCLLAVSCSALWGISIHAPREGSDWTCWTAGLCWRAFLSTLPARGATRQPDAGPCHRHISIHAPREGSDKLKKPRGSWPPYFYPRSPRGERLYDYGNNTAQFLFLSTLPARGATVCRCCLEHVPEISIHAPREGSDFGRAYTIL